MFYSIIKKFFFYEINYFTHRILKIKFVKGNTRIAAIDSLGSFIIFDINLKTIMDKILVTSVDTFQIYE